MDDLLDAAAERANTAQMIFTLIDSEGAGTVPMTSVRASARPSIQNTAVLTPWTCPNFCPRRASTPSPSLDAPPRPPPQLGPMLMSMLLSQELDYDGDDAPRER